MINYLILDSEALELIKPLIPFPHTKLGEMKISDYVLGHDFVVEGYPFR